MSPVVCQQDSEQLVRISKPLGCGSSLGLGDVVVQSSIAPHTRISVELVEQHILMGVCYM